MTPAAAPPEPATVADATRFAPEVIALPASAGPPTPLARGSEDARAAASGSTVLDLGELDGAQGRTAVDRDAPTLLGAASSSGEVGADPAATATTAFKNTPPPARTTSTRRIAVIPDPVSSDDPLVGQTVEGKYRVLAPLGAGGMASVYKAWHLLLEREVALKFIRRGSARSEQFRERFFREAQISSELIHPHIVPTREFGETARGEFYMVMDFIAGRTLATTLVEEERLPAARAVRIVAEALDAVEAVHRRGVVHGDLKPSNIMLDAAGHTWVLDFGLAREPGEEVVGATGVVGTPHYMSPEQAAGLPVDPRVDLWALGLILHEALCGKRPYEADTVEELLVKRREVPVPRPAALAPGVVVPPRVEAALMRALELDPTRRWQTAAEFRRALLEAQEARAIDPLLSLGAGFAAGGAVVLAGMTLVALVLAVIWRDAPSVAPPPVASPPAPVVVAPTPTAKPTPTPTPELPAGPVVTEQDVARARAAALEAGARDLAAGELAEAEARWAADQKGGDPAARAAARERYVQVLVLASGRRGLQGAVERGRAARAAAEALEGELRALLADVTLGERFERALARLDAARQAGGEVVDPLQVVAADLLRALEREEAAERAWDEARAALAALLPPARDADPGARVAERRAAACAAGAEAHAPLELAEADRRWAAARERSGGDGLAALEDAAAGFDRVAGVVGERVRARALAEEVAVLAGEAREALERSRRNLADVHLGDEFRAATALLERAELLDRLPAAVDPAAERAALERRRDAWRVARDALRGLAGRSADVHGVKTLLSRLSAAMVRTDLREVVALYADPADDLRFLTATFERARRLRFLAGAPRLEGAEATADLTEFSYEDGATGRRQSLEGMRVTMRRGDDGWRVVNIRRVAR